ncbi:galactitol-1-phosphate 5-dehydrogenase [Sinobaca sp. H24]|uniref:galactitol-1-phosphate 5-dehydrogenase n=1 Tax=Sinobaca sp. H24 TaxID=2923376 RepID=UPI0020798E66|nr:galactitol-1-phosphate 5-dehydrogenase [Sinobaca sp. H24]
MKALNLYGVQDIRCEETSEPVITAPDDVIIKVKAAGICGSDISRFNKLGPYIEGMTFGHEFAGEVLEVGSHVKGIVKGDKVAGCPAFYCGVCISCQKGEFSQCEKLTVIGARHPGSYAEKVKLPAENVIKIPDNVDYDTAALLEPAAVVAHGFYKTNVKPGDTVAVMGCGSIGLLAIQWARIFGAKTIFAIDIDETKLAAAKELGADVLVNSLEGPAHEKVLEHTSSMGVNLAVESAGSPITSAQIFALPKKGGEVVFLGIPYADITIERFYFEKIVRNELSVYGSWNGVSSPFPGQEWDAAMHYMGTGQITSGEMVHHRYSLDEGPRVFDDLIQRKGNHIKVLFYPET